MSATADTALLQGQPPARWTYYLVMLLAAVISFEDFILKFLPGPESVYFASRFLSELSIYGALFLVVSRKLIHGIGLCHTPIDVPVFVFLVAMLLSMLFNQSSLFDSLLSLRPVIRYIFLYYLLANISLTPRQVTNIVWVVITAGAVQIVFGLAQFVAGGFLDPLLRPRELTISVGDKVKRSAILSGRREIGAIYGAAPDTELYASFMLITFVAVIGKLRLRLYTTARDLASRDTKPRDLLTLVAKNSIVLFVLIPLAMIVTLMSYVRIGLLLMLFVLALEAYHFLGPRILAFFGLQFVLLLVLTIIAFPPHWQGGGARLRETNPLQDISSVFTLEYLQTNADNQRLAQLLGVAPTVLIHSPMFGFGPVEAVTIEQINNAEPSMLRKKLERSEFKDVYWVAILANYGLLGLFALFWIFYRLFYSAVVMYGGSERPLEKEVSLVVANLVVVTILLMFINRCVEFRTYGFYFWLFPGLMASLVNHRDLRSRISRRPP